VLLLASKSATGIRLKVGSAAARGRQVSWRRASAVLELKSGRGEVESAAARGKLRL